MSKKENSVILMFIIVVSLITVSVYVIGMYWVEYENTFFELGLLGKNGKADNYFKNDKPDLYIGTPVTWYIYVHNHVGTEQDVIIKAKLLNYTMQLPDDKNNVPSPKPPIIEYQVSLDKDETVIIPYSWSILDAEYVYNHTTVEKLVYQGEDITIVKEPLDATIIKRVIINGETHETNMVSYSNPTHKFVFELWVYDPIQGMYMYGWRSQEGFNSASVYILFRFKL